ncbi:MAG: ribosome small subunit-dependent GTPase A [Calditrichaeota bacterium]|nr:MAG: ribosome small subunit-dependent GTPase A [Calditrichota bacterium]
MGRLTKRQQQIIKYQLRDRLDRRKKADMIHSGEVPKYVRDKIPYIRRLSRSLDQVLIVASFQQPELKTGLIDRLLVMAELEERHALICLNKYDLLEHPGQAEQVAGIYRSIGYPVYITSAKSGKGVAALARALSGKRSAMAGHSGVGKSSLLNAINPELKVATGAVSYATNKGRHTTTQIKTYTLDEQTELIDLPGLKQIDFFDVHRDEARFYFREFLTPAESCRFNNCLHLTERDCAVKEAVKSGRISASRYESYRQFVETLT